MTLEEKIERFTALTTYITDTLLDLASYAIMSVIELENDQENKAQVDGDQEECVSAPKTGEWVHAEANGDEDRFWCSVCKDRGGTWPGDSPPPFEYCPHCGSKMKFPKEEEQ